jgi:hypothetical protein
VTTFLKCHYNQNKNTTLSFKIGPNLTISIPIRQALIGLGRDTRASLFLLAVSDEKQKFYDFDATGVRGDSTRGGSWKRRIPAGNFANTF